MPLIQRARHVGYDWKGRPIVRQLPDWTCVNTPPTFFFLREFAYTEDGYPREAYAWTCCDGFCTDAEVSGGTCYELADGNTWPLGPNYPTLGGITKRMGVFISDDNTCLSANNLKGTLLFDAGTSSWTGTFTLRNCTLTLTVTVDPTLLPNGTDPTGNDPSKFKLVYSGSTGDSGTVFAGYNCSDPLLVNFGIIQLPKCCQCPGSGAGTTDSGASINVWITANCRPVRAARHSYYEKDSAGNLIPVVANARNCPWDHVDPDGCTIMTCPLNATVTSASCSCLVGTWTLDYHSAHWDNINVGVACAAPATIRLTCSAAGTDANGNTLVSLQCDVICGVTNTGTATKTVLASDLENLDETFAITMGDTTPPDPAACCSAGSTLSVRITRA